MTGGVIDGHWLSVGLGAWICVGEGEGVLFWICRGFHQLPFELTCGPSLKDKATGAHRWGPAVGLGIFMESPSIPEPV